MKLRDTGGIVALAALSGIAGLACSEADHSRQPMDKPPPPPPSTAVAQTYDYTHSINQERGSRLTRKFVLALVRFGDDRQVEEVPYGTQPDKERPTAEGATTIEVDVQLGDRNAAVDDKQPLSMNRRAREILKHELMETDSFVLVERERILDILREQLFGQTKFVNPDTSPEMGEVMAVQYLLEGSIGPNEDRSLKDTLEPPPSYKDGDPSFWESISNPSKASQRTRLKQLHRMRIQEAARRQIRNQNCIGVYLSLYDVRTSRIAVEAFGIGGNGLEAIRDAVDDLVDKCLEIPNPVRIAAVDGDYVYLDLGADDKVDVGQKFRYLSPGPEIRNSAGQVIGTRDEESGELEITRVDQLMSVGKVTLRVADPVVGARVEPLD